MNRFILKTLYVACFSSTLLLTGCGGDSNSTPETPSGMSLSILHINDHHSNLDETKTKLTLNGEEIEMVTGGFPRVVSAMKALEQTTTSANVLKLHAGDAITGTLFYTLFNGKADADLMNEVCFDAFALGNHEFDSGDEGLKTFLDYLNAGNCATPTTVLAANIKPKVGTPLAPNNVDDYIQPYLIKSYGSEKVGIIGINIKSKTQLSSSPADTTVFSDELTTAQATIDILKGMNINKIVLLTHYQYDNDKTLASQLEGVDVIIGGDSHTLLGDFSAYGLNSAGDYPTQVTDKNGKKVCVAQAWQYSQVVGELSVNFDGNGDVTSCSGTPHLLVDAPFKKNNVALTDEETLSIKAQLSNETNLRLTSTDVQARAVLANFKGQVDELKNTVIGTSTDVLCLERIPGEGRSTLCNVQDTLPHGGDIQTLVAHAFRSMSKTSDIAIQNAGGVRIDVPEGELTIGTAYTLLPFSNTLLELEMTGAEVISVLEDAVDFAITPDGSTGAYPYAAGLRWDVNLSQAKGSRLSNIEFKGPSDGEWVALNSSQTYTVVTNNYIAGGKDGYTTFGLIDDSKKVDTFLDYAQSFVDYVESQPNTTVSKLPYSEYSTQNFTDISGLTTATKR